MTNVLLLPGLWNSGPEHWQSFWERQHPEFRRVLQADWETPRRADWVAGLEAAIAVSERPVVLAAHSASCALVAHWAATTNDAERVRGALLVAPSDVEAPSYPAGPTGFAPMPLQRLPFPNIVVASSDDPYVSLERAELFARCWGSVLVNVGSKGHINGASGLGSWAEGFALLERLRTLPGGRPARAG